MGIFIGALGVSNSLQNALNSVWEIPFARRPGFPWSWLRSAALIIVVGLGFIVTTTLSVLAAGVHVLHHDTVRAGHRGVAGAELRAVLARLPARHREGNHLAAALAGRGHRRGHLADPADSVGTNFISHQLAHASPLYGTFALVLGLIAWLYLQAQLTLYAVEINVVWSYRLWPRSLAPPPHTEQDRRAFQLYVEKRRDQWDIVAGAGGEDDGEKTSD